MLPAILLASGAWAQEPDGPPLDLQAVLVAPFEPAEPELRPDAARLRRVVEDALSTSHLVVPLAEVPAFAGYGADVYVRSCPDGRYVDCAFVVGQRGRADWVVGGTLRAVEGGLVVDLVLVEVATGSLVIDLEVGFDGDGDEVAARSLGPLLDRALAGGLAPTDLRADPEGVPLPEELDATDLTAASEELAQLEAEEGAVDRDDRREGQVAKVGVDEVRRWRDGDATPPWEAVDLSPSSWRRWKSSGRSLAAHRALARGRQGEILLGVQLVGLSWGPWAQDWALWYARDSVTLQIEEQYAQLDLAPGLARSWEVSLGAGPLPWLDLAVVGGVRLLPWRWSLQRIAIGEPPREPETGERLETTPVVGGRVTFAPMPAFPARPLVQLGVLHAWGTPSSRVIATPDGVVQLPAARWLLAQVNAGVEVSVGRTLLLWARAELEIPLGRYVPDPVLRGGASLQGRPTPDTSDESVAIGGAIGGTLRLRVPRRR